MNVHEDQKEDTTKKYVMIYKTPLIFYLFNPLSSIRKQNTARELLQK